MTTVIDARAWVTCWGNFDAVETISTSRSSCRLSAPASRSLRETDVRAFFVQNVTLTTERLVRGADLQFSVQNLFDRQYSDPGAEEHLQAAIPQDGRTLRMRLGFRF